MYQVRLKPKAKKALREIKNKLKKKKIITALIDLRKDPFVGKKLKGKYKDSYSFQVWPYRIIYEIYKRQLLVIVIRIGLRGGGVYR